MTYLKIRLLALVSLSIMSILLVSSCRELPSPVAAVDPIPEIETFNDHSEALVSWMKKGHEDMVLVHVDHHSDCEYVPEHKIQHLKRLYKNKEWVAG
jgi:hypothetical protein